MGSCTIVQHKATLVEGTCDWGHMLSMINLPAYLHQCISVEASVSGIACYKPSQTRCLPYIKLYLKYIMLLLELYMEHHALIFIMSLERDIKH